MYSINSINNHISLKKSSEGIKKIQFLTPQPSNKSSLFFQYSNNSFLIGIAGLLFKNHFHKQDILTVGD